jgi:hypothetical protein
VSLMAMDPFCKSCVTTNLASIHYVTFIEPLVVFSTEAMSFDSKQFTNISINKEIELKTEDPFLVLDEHFFTADLVYKTHYKVQFQGLSHEVLEFFS